ncbi:hypothetical protein [Flavobacterium sp. ZB4R12]|uniref:hypothetical protein n=1 Tax=Flavobacterium sp. ZB4R12 TaxID=3398732 RepID=UPI003AAC8AE7
MRTSKVILGFKRPIEISNMERRQIVEEYIVSGKTKQDIWKKHTGQEVERGQLTRWMRQLGFIESNNISKLEDVNTQDMAKSKEQYWAENLQLKQKIEELEKALVNSELRATVFETMIEVAEKELKISIKKKSFTRRSTK